MPVRIFLSTVSNEFREYRDQLRGDLTRHNVDVKVQEDFKDYGDVTLEKLDIYIKSCDAVVHLVGNMIGSLAKKDSTNSILTKYSDITDKVPPLRSALEMGKITYTQWEAWLALYHDKLLLIATPDEAAPRGPNYAPTAESRDDQQAHLKRLQTMERYPGSKFTSPDNLAKQIAYTVILDLLAADRAQAHLGGLIESLIDIGTMLFVDLIRLACVAGSEAARAADEPRYKEFVDIADLHLAEFSTHVSRLTAHIGSDIVRKCLQVEKHAAYVLVRLRRGPNLDRGWLEFVDVLANLAGQVHELAASTLRDIYSKKVEEIITVVRPSIMNATTLSTLQVPDEFVRVRFLAQSMVLREIVAKEKPPIMTIRDDIDRRLAVPYFVIDATLLQATGEAGKPLRPLSVGHYSL